MKNFWDGFEKQSAARSEALGALPWGPLSALGALAGIAVGPYSDKDRKKVNKESISNLIPGVGGYRAGRRLSGDGLDADERPND